VEKPRHLTHETPEGHVQCTLAAYDGEIAYNDAQFGRLLEGLKAEGLYKDSFVFFLSDHGEEHLEHGQGGHSHTLYQELVRVPLVVKYPREAFAGRTVGARVSILDVMPTVLRVLGEEIPAHLDGSDLTVKVAGKDGRAMDRSLFFDLDTQRFDGSINIVDAVLSGKYKFIHRTFPEEKESLFDLSKDPGEQINLVETHPDEADRLKALMAGHRLSTRRGVLLRVINSADGGVRIYEGSLTTEGRFTGLERSQFEKEDQVRLEEAGTRLVFRLVSRNYKNPLQKILPRIIDEDRFTFRLDPADAPFSIESFRCEGGAADLYLGQERKKAGTLPITYRPDDLEIVALDDSVLRRTSDQTVSELPPGGYLVSVPGKIREDAEMDEALRERLRALGYIK
jgi:hypothetical protein